MAKKKLALIHTVHWYDSVITTLRCPSDPRVGLPSFGRTNYAACLGDSPARGAEGPVSHALVLTSFYAEQCRAAQRGVFVPRQTMRFRDILDGLANTIMAGEIVTDLGDQDARTNPKVSYSIGMPSVTVETIPVRPNTCGTAAQLDANRPQFWASSTGTLAVTNTNEARGYRWAEGSPVFSAMNTLSPPNKPACVATANENGGSERQRTGIFPPGSRHQGGCHVLMGDGAVKFVTDSIEAGDQSAVPIHKAGVTAATGKASPYGLWGSPGSRASKEVIQEEL